MPVTTLLSATEIAEANFGIVHGIKDGSGFDNASWRHFFSVRRQERLEGALD